MGARIVGGISHSQWNYDFHRSQWLQQLHFHHSRVERGDRSLYRVFQGSMVSD